MSLADHAGIQGIAFSLLSVGAYKGNRPLHILAKIALLSICARGYNHIAEVHFCAYTEDDYLTLVEAARNFRWVGLENMV